MKTNQLLIAFVLFALLLSGCGAKEASLTAVPAGTQTRDQTELQDCKFQLEESETNYAAECSTPVACRNAFAMAGDSTTGYHTFFIGVPDSKLVVTALVNTVEGNVISPSVTALEYISQ